MTEIAVKHVVFVFPNRGRRVGRIAIDQPEWLTETEACCTLVLDGMQPPSRVHGATTLQALVLALRLARQRLHHFVADGGRVLDPEDDSDVEIDTLFAV